MDQDFVITKSVFGIAMALLVLGIVLICQAGPTFFGVVIPVLGVASIFWGLWIAHRFWKSL